MEVLIGSGADAMLSSDEGSDEVLFTFGLTIAGRPSPLLSVGTRLGLVSVTTDGGVLGLPLDLVLHTDIADGRVYIEALVGSWLVFGGDPSTTARCWSDSPGVCGHAALGFGLQSRTAALGLELGYLDAFKFIQERVDGAFTLGLRFMFRL